MASSSTCSRFPVRAPKANAYAERFARTVRAECLDSMLILGRRHLERLLRIDTTHYNRERTHRGLALAAPKPADAISPPPPAKYNAATDSAGSSTNTTQLRHESHFETPQALGRLTTPASRAAA